MENFQLTRGQKFDRICNALRKQFDYKAYSNSLYRNERAIMWMFGWIIEHEEFDSSNSITKDDALARGFPDEPSSWSQRSKYIKHFGFEDDWDSSTTEIILNDKGIELKESIKNYMRENGINDIKNFKNDPPEFVRRAYYDSIKGQLLNGCTPTMKTLLCTVNMLLNIEFFDSRETFWKNPPDNYRDLVSNYFDAKQPEGDLKWVGHFGRGLQGLGIAHKVERDKKWVMSERGVDLVDKIIENWESEYPNIFNELYSGDTEYIPSTGYPSIPFESDKEVHIRKNAAITGKEAEDYFVAWAKEKGWKVVDMTDTVNVGYDFECIDEGGNKIFVEVKGCRDDLESIRLTEYEWTIAKELGHEYRLIIISKLNTEKEVYQYQNPYNLFYNFVGEPKVVLSRTYHIKKKYLIDALK